MATDHQKDAAGWLDSLLCSQGFVPRQTRAGVLGYVKYLGKKGSSGSVALLPSEGETFTGLNQPVLLCEYNPIGEMTEDRTCNTLREALELLGIDVPPAERGSENKFAPVQFIDQI